MKKSILMVAMMLGISTATFAQNENNSPEDRAKMRAEMVQRFRLPEKAAALLPADCHPSDLLHRHPCGE